MRRERVILLPVRAQIGKRKFRVASLPLTAETTPTLVAVAALRRRLRHKGVIVERPTLLAPLRLWLLTQFLLLLSLLLAAAALLKRGDLLTRHVVDAVGEGARARPGRQVVRRPARARLRRRQPRFDRRQLLLFVLVDAAARVER